MQSPTVPGYDVREEIGRGSHGVVYRAFDNCLGAEVALKTLEVEEEQAGRLLKEEFRALRALEHPNLVRYLDLVVSEEASLFTMELVDGVDIVQYVRRGQPGLLGTAALERLVEVTRQLISALVFLHRQAILHRDIKPANILVTRTGRLVLLDFGLAVHPLSLERPEDLRGRMVGTPAYLAPECLWGAPHSAASDWYSVGAVLYEAIHGEDPPRRDLHGTRRGWLPSAPISGRARAVVELVDALLAPEPGNRPTDALLVDGADWGSDLLISEGLKGGSAFGHSPLRGRQEELRRLRDSFDDGPEGSSSLLRIHGDSGIGKTRLVQAFIDDLEARESDVVVLQGQCAAEERIPFRALDGVVHELAKYLGSVGPMELAPLIPSDWGLLSAVFGALRSVDVREQGELTAVPDLQEARRRALEALRQVLVRLARNRRVILWIDNAHHGDVDSAKFIVSLCTLVEPASLLVIVSARASAESELLSVLDGAQKQDLRASTIELEPLRAAALGEIVVDGLGRRPENLDRIIDEAAGNPFVALQVAQSHDSYRLREDVPIIDGIVDAMARELAGPTRELLEVLAVSGVPLNASIAAEVVPSKDVPVVSSLMTLSSLALVRVVRDVRGGWTIRHDRFRAAVLQMLEPERRTGIHLRLARRLEMESAPPLGRLAFHYSEGKEYAEAAVWSELAGDSAMQAYAFHQAIEHYSNAQRWATEPSVEIQRRIGRALSYTGQAVRAAEVFSTAAEECSGLRADTLRREAAEQLFSAGHITAGLDILRPLLVQRGLPFPETQLRAGARVLPGVLRLTIADVDFAVGRDLTGDESFEIDLLWTGARGLIMTDFVRGAYFSLQCFWLARRRGSGAAMAKALGLIASSLLVPVGSMLPVIGRFVRAKGMRLLEETRDFAQATADRYLIGFIGLSNGQALLFDGRWRETLEACDEAVSTLQGGCQGVFGECNSGRMGAMRALEELGRIDEMIERAEVLLRSARSLENLYAETTSSLYLGFGALARDRPSEAREWARGALRHWTQESFHIQHLYSLRLEALALAYDGNWVEALEMLERSWGSIESSILLRVPMTRVDAYLLRGRLRLGAASDRNSLAAVEADARRLEQTTRPDAIAHAALLRAGVTARDGRDDEARRCLQDAQARYQTLGLALMESVARARSAGWERSETSTLADVEERMTEAGVSNPSRWLDLVAPGFSSQVARTA